MPEPKQYDAIVIGSGQGGKPLAVALAKAGWKTALIEREYIGGTCVNVGCTPTKTMFNSARVAYLARRRPETLVCIPDAGQREHGGKFARGNNGWSKAFAMAACDPSKLPGDLIC